MTSVSTFLMAQYLFAKNALAQHLRRMSTRASEEGSQTSDYLLIALGVIAVAAIAVAGITFYVNGRVAELNG